MSENQLQGVRFFEFLTGEERFEFMEGSELAAFEQGEQIISEGARPGSGERYEHLPPSAHGSVVVHGFDVVAVGIQHEGGVVPGVVFGA